MILFLKYGVYLEWLWSRRSKVPSGNQCICLRGVDHIQILPVYHSLLRFYRQLDVSKCVRCVEAAI
jgi:hypothetical protein